MCGATSPTHHHPTLSHPNAKGRVTAHSPPPPSPIQTRGAASPPTVSPPPPSPIQTRRAASPPTRHHLPLPFRREGPRHRPPCHHHLPLPSKREGPRHRPLATTSLSHSDARGRVTPPSPPPPSPIQTRRAASPPTESPPPPSPIQTRRAASPPTRHHLPLPFRREGPRHRPLATTSLSHSDARGRVTTHSPPPPSPIQMRRAASPPTRHHLPLPFRREGPRHRPLAPTSLSHSDAKGRVTAHRVAPSSLPHSAAKGRVTAHRLATTPL